MARRAHALVVTGVLGAAAGAGALAPTAGAYPPITCGRLGHYVVRTHGPSCAFALHGLRVYLAHHRGPRGYSCKTYSATILCRVPGHTVPDVSYRYFTAG